MMYYIYKNISKDCNKLKYITKKLHFQQIRIKATNQIDINFHNTFVDILFSVRELEWILKIMVTIY